MLTIEYNATRYCNSPLNNVPALTRNCQKCPSSRRTSIDSEIFLHRFNEMEKNKLRLLYDNDGSKNSSREHYIWEQGTKNTEYDM